MSGGICRGLLGSDRVEEVSEPGLQDWSRGGDDIGQSGAAQVNRASETASENVPGGDPCCPGSLTSFSGPFWCPSCSRAFQSVLTTNHGQPCCPTCGTLLEEQGAGDDDPEA